MTCKNCRPILNELDLLPTGEVDLCEVHALTERLAEALKFMYKPATLRDRADMPENVAVLIAAYDRAKTAQESASGRKE